jgi:dephospho-CoA kinase
MFILGITGGIASGKSTVTSMLGHLGAQTRSADADARAILEPGSPTRDAVLAAFPEARDAGGGIDRAALAARIFGDPEERAKLEAITHPAIIARMRVTTDAARTAGPGVLAYETPLLYEVNLAPLFDAVVAVAAPPQLQAERLQARERAAGRDPLSESELAARLSAQLSSDEKARRADFVIRTDGAMADTEAQVRALWGTLTTARASMLPGVAVEPGAREP